MEVGVQEQIDASSRMIFIFLNAGLAKIEEAIRIEDKNKEYRNIKKKIKGWKQHQRGLITNVRNIKKNI